MTTLEAVVIDTNVYSALYTRRRRDDHRRDEWVARLPTIHESPEVTDNYAALTAACKIAGHPLHGKIHTGDRWIAACAITLGLKLFAGDRIYAGAPGLSLP